jgi:hypothetical protein
MLVMRTPIRWPPSSPLQPSSTVRTVTAWKRIGLIGSWSSSSRERPPFERSWPPTRRAGTINASPVLLMSRVCPVTVSAGATHAAASCDEMLKSTRKACRRLTRGAARSSSVGPEGLALPRRRSVMARIRRDIFLVKLQCSIPCCLSSSSLSRR